MGYISVLFTYLLTYSPVANLRGTEPAPAPPLGDGPTPSQYS